jgi:transcriptional regulator with XRE-family HTH domain
VSRGRSAEKRAQFRGALIKARKKAGLTQAAVAARLERPQSFVSKYEGGERRLDVVEFLEVARAVGFNPAGFLAKFEAL